MNARQRFVLVLFYFFLNKDGGDSQNKDKRSQQYKTGEEFGRV